MPECLFVKVQYSSKLLTEAEKNKDSQISRRI